MYPIRNSRNSGPFRIEHKNTLRSRKRETRRLLVKEVTLWHTRQEAATCPVCTTLRRQACAQS